MRGKLANLVAVIGGMRITPADAGKTASNSALVSGVRDHPRGCGENSEIQNLQART